MPIDGKKYLIDCDCADPLNASLESLELLEINIGRFWNIKFTRSGAYHQMMAKNLECNDVLYGSIALTEEQARENGLRKIALYYSSQV